MHQPANDSPPAVGADATSFHVRFTCTLDDFLDATKIHRGPARRDRIGLGERLLFIWMLLAVVVVVFTVGVVEGIYRAASGGPTVELLVSSWVIAIVAPWIPWLLIAGLMWFAASGMLGPNDRRPIRRMMLVLAAVGLINAVIMAMATGGPNGAAKPAEQPERETPVMLTLLPWLMIFGVLWFFIFRYMRGMLPRHWDAQPHLRREQTMEPTEHGLRFDDGLCVRDYRWNGFTKFREGEGMFLLYVSEVGFHMVPKRAFASPGAVESFRQLLEQRVPSDGPIAGRFPVQVGVHTAGAPASASDPGESPAPSRPPA